MKKILAALDQSERLTELESYAILDTSPEEEFDQITRFASKVCQVPVAFICLMDDKRKWFKSHIGVGLAEVSREVPYCAHAIFQDDVFVIEDVDQDQEFCKDPELKKTANIKFYAGVSLKTTDGVRLGTLSITDTKARKLSDEQAETLKFLADQVVILLAKRKQLLDLAQMKQSFQDIQEMTSSGSWASEVKTGKTFWSKGIYDIHGVDYGTPIKRVDAISFYAEHEREKIFRLIENCITKQEPYDDIFEFYDQSGQKKWVRTLGRPILNKENEVLEIQGTFQDVTELVEKEKEVSLVIDNISEGYFDWHIEDDYEYFSPTFWQLLGYDPESKKHHPDEFEKIVHPSDIEFVLSTHDLIFQAKEEYHYSFDVRLKHFKGHYIWMRMSGKIVERDYGERPVRIVGTGRDIHQEKLKNHEIRMTERGLDVHAIVAKTDPKGRIFYVNDLFCEISGYSKKELLGKDHRIINSGHHPKPFFKEMWKTISSKNSWRGEIKNKAKDGGHYWVDTTIIPIIDINGDIQGYTAFRYDITSRKEAEIELAKSNENLDFALEGAELGMSVWDMSDDSVLFDARCATLMGFGPKEMKMRRAMWDDRIHSDDLEECYAKLQAYADGKTKQCESIFRIRHIDGHWLYILGKGRFSEWDSSGRPIKFTMTHLDVTQLMEQKHSLEVINKRMALVLDGANIATWVWDVGTDQIVYDEKWSKMFGLNYSELKMDVSEWESRVHPDEYARSAEKMRRYLNRETEIFEDEQRVLHSQNYWVYIQTKAVVTQKTKGGRPKKVTGIVMDITDRRKREEVMLLISHVRARFIELSSDTNMFFGYLLKKILKVTESEYGFIGEVLEDEKGLYLKSLILSDGSWSEETQKKHDEAIFHGMETRNLNTLLGSVVKSKKNLIVNDAQNHSDSLGHLNLNNFLGVPVINEDHFFIVAVGNKKGGYSELDIEFLQPFFDLIGEIIRSIKLKESFERERQVSMHQSKLASIGELAAGVGHEINNPLAIIQGQLGMLKKHCDKKKALDDVIEDKLEKSFKSIKRISNIVKGLRSFSRIDDVTLEVFDLKQLIDESIEMIKDVYQLDNITIDFHSSDELWIEANPGKIQQVLVNLLNNSRDVLINQDIKTIKISARLEGEQAVIKVQDSGPGISKELQGKIFDPFFTTKEVGKGTGIGLALVSSILKEYLGSIELDSGVSEGACFIIKLPQATVQAKEQSQAAHTQLQAQRQIKVLEDQHSSLNGRVLLVDDEEDIREILQDSLEALGLKVLVAGNGQEALDILENHKSQIDVILSDMKMPVMNGLELARNLSRMSYSGGFFFITGAVDTDTAELPAIVKGCIEKPFVADDVFEEIKSFFSRVS